MKTISLYLPNITKPEPDYEAISIETDVALQTIPDGSCDEIIINNVLDFLDTSNRQNILKLTISKLAYDGTIVICGLDFLMLSRDVLAQIITIEQANVLYGNKKSIETAETTVVFLQQQGLKIIQKRLSEHTYSIIAQREYNA